MKTCLNTNELRICVRYIGRNEDILSRIACFLKKLLAIYTLLAQGNPEKK